MDANEIWELAAKTIDEEHFDSKIWILTKLYVDLGISHLIPNQYFGQDCRNYIYARSLARFNKKHRN